MKSLVVKQGFSFILAIQHANQLLSIRKAFLFYF